MDNNSRKDLISQYKEREMTGGVYQIKNTTSGRLYLDATTDIASIRNRFEFSVKTGSCVYMKLQKDWAEHGAGSFTFETLEELKKTDTQTSASFKADVELLKSMWLEKMSGKDLY